MKKRRWCTVVSNAALQNQSAAVRAVRRRGLGSDRTDGGGDENDQRIDAAESHGVSRVCLARASAAANRLRTSARVVDGSSALNHQRRSPELASGEARVENQRPPRTGHASDAAMASARPEDRRDRGAAPDYLLRGKMMAGRGLVPAFEHLRRRRDGTGASFPQRDRGARIRRTSRAAFSCGYSRTGVRPCSATFSTIRAGGTGSVIETLRM